MIILSSNPLIRFFGNTYHRMFVTMFLLFIFRPIGESYIYFAMWDLVLCVSVLFAIFAFSTNRVVRTVALIFAIPAIICNWLYFLYPESFLFLGNAFGALFYIIICIGSIIRKATKSLDDPIDSLKGVICAFLLVGFLFAYAYYITSYLQPESFKFFALEESSIFTYSAYLSDMLYMSYMILLTVGIGDITPIRHISQSLTVMEGFIGQIYMAVLVGSVVSVYTLYRLKRNSIHQQ